MINVNAENEKIYRERAKTWKITDKSRRRSLWQLLGGQRFAQGRPATERIKPVTFRLGRSHSDLSLVSPT